MIKISIKEIYGKASSINLAQAIETFFFAELVKVLP